MKFLKVLHIILLVTFLLMLVTFKIFYEEKDNLKNLAELLLIIVGGVTSMLYIVVNYLGKSTKRDKLMLLLEYYKKVMKSPIRMILFSVVYIFFTGMFFYHLFFTRYVDILVDEKVYLIEDLHTLTYCSVNKR